MIGSGLKKLALANGMTVGNGVAYGSFRGYATTFSEGAGYKTVTITAYFPDPAAREGLRSYLASQDLNKAFRVNRLDIMPQYIRINFTDNPGTMKRIEAFLDWFLPLLPHYRVAWSNVCPICGGELVGGQWVLSDGAAYHVHESCARGMTAAVETENVRQKEEQTGSYLTGALGAAAGSVIGSILWAIVASVGYVASLVGFVIAWLAGKGYRLCKGKNGKGMIAILIIVTLLGVILGTFFGYCIAVYQELPDMGIKHVAFSEIPGIVLEAITENSEVAGEVVKDVLIGILFAALGAFSVIRNTTMEVADKKAPVMLRNPNDMK